MNFSALLIDCFLLQHYVLVHILDMCALIEIESTANKNVDLCVSNDPSMVLQRVCFSSATATVHSNKNSRSLDAEHDYKDVSVLSAMSQQLPPPSAMRRPRDRLSASSAPYFASKCIHKVTVDPDTLMPILVTERSMRLQEAISFSQIYSTLYQNTMTAVLKSCPKCLQRLAYPWKASMLVMYLGVTMNLSIKMMNVLHDTYNHECFS